MEMADSREGKEDKRQCVDKWEENHFIFLVRENRFDSNKYAIY